MVAHVSVAVKMHHKRHCRNDDKKERRNRIKKETETNDKFVGKLQPVVIEQYDLKTFAGLVYKLRASREEISEGYSISQHHCDSHTQCTENSGHLMGHVLTEQPEDEEHAQWYAKYED